MSTVRNLLGKGGCSQADEGGIPPGRTGTITQPGRQNDTLFGSGSAGLGDGHKIYGIDDFGDLLNHRGFVDLIGHRVDHQQRAALGCFLVPRRPQLYRSATRLQRPLRNRRGRARHHR